MRGSVPFALFPLPLGEGRGEGIEEVCRVPFLLLFRPMEVSVASSALRAPGRAWVRKRVVEIARAAGARAAEVSILLCGDRRMRALNRRYRGKDRPTDVLAFPAGEGGPFPGARPRNALLRADGNRLLGDIAISVPYASRQARSAGEPLAREIHRLLLHGVLHLMGYDHETDQGEMDALEAKLRRRLGMTSTHRTRGSRGRAPA